MAEYIKKATRKAAHGADAELTSRVSNLLREVEVDGENAVRRMSAEFDKWEPAQFRLSDAQVEKVIAGVSKQTIHDIEFAQKQIRNFAKAQLASLNPVEVETLPGVTLGHKLIPVGSVGAYVPGGRYPMVASAHMSVLTAKVAGVKRV
ncbi:MAG: histidinol dehydrogenase, partial [Actinobacteria bacterium]|nr:histidinol dehydrogenase [Actinomycetota bacterium]